MGVDAGSTSATASADMAAVEGFAVTEAAGASCGHGLTEEDLLDYEGGPQ